MALRAHIGLLPALLIGMSLSDARPAFAVDMLFARPELISGSTLGPRELAVIVNDRDPVSRAIARYYRERRHIPAANFIHVEIDRAASLTPDEFRRLKARVDGMTPPAVQAYALTWSAPYRVGCMSITTAFAAGYDDAFCADTCAATRLNPYFNSTSRRPHRDHRIRPTMALVGSSVEQAKRLIDRGIASDGTFPTGTAYLVSTSDTARNIRAAVYPEIARRLRGRIAIKTVNADYLESARGILFYFIGAVTIPALTTNEFLPGAVADHLTSTGGRLTDSTQMSSLRWLEAGATGSYGTVVEPCNIPAKFPHPGIVMSHYLSGDTLIEAYWKSVGMPGQGIFIGEPLARPFAPRRLPDPPD